MTIGFDCAKASAAARQSNNVMRISGYSN
jgi:hypothetical protein